MQNDLSTREGLFCIITYRLACDVQLMKVANPKRPCTYLYRESRLQWEARMKKRKKAAKRKKRRGDVKNRFSFLD